MLELVQKNNEVHILNSKTKLDAYMKTEREKKTHLGLSFGVYSNKSSQFWNYGTHNDKAITESNYFELASTGKIFTSILILRLEELGLLSITDFVERYIEEFPVRNKVTLYNLLTHTSGLPHSPSNWTDLAPKNSFANYTREIFFEDLKSVCLLEDRYGHFSYSNYNYILLGLIATKVSQEKEFTNLLEKEVLKPLGLNETKFNLSEDEVRGRLITGHDSDLSPIAPYLDLGEVYCSTGALKTTTKELLDFAKILIGKSDAPKSLETPLKKLMYISEDVDGNLLSLGFHIRKNDHGIAYFHPGSIAGIKCSLVINPDKKLAQVYVSNTLNHVRILWDIFYSE